MLDGFGTFHRRELNAIVFDGMDNVAQLIQGCNDHINADWSIKMCMIVQHCLMFMLVIISVLAMNMDMGVCVRMLMGMDNTAMAVFVGMDMVMLMGVLQFDGVFNHKICADNHRNQGNIELKCRSFSQNQHTKCHTKERRNGVVGTGFGCAQVLLRHDIEIDAQAIGNKAKQ